MKKKHIVYSTLLTVLILVISTTPVLAMHIMDGYLSPFWATLWYCLSLPVLFLGLKSIKKLTANNPSLKMLLGVCGAFAFVLSSLKLPSITGSSSHPTGVGLGTILFGPTASSILALIVLLFQALLLAHGGLSTLGANVFSMGIAGPVAAYLIYRGMNKVGASKSVSVFLATSLGSLVTYLVASIQLGLAFPTDVGVLASIIKFIGIFAITQIPLAISEGILTVVVLNLLTTYNQEELEELSFARGER